MSRACAQAGLAIFLESPLLKVVKMYLQRLMQRNEKAMASSDKSAKAVFKVDAARVLKARGRVSKKESKVTFDDRGKELPSTSQRDSSGKLEGP